MIVERDNETCLCMLSDAFNTDIVVCGGIQGNTHWDTCEAYTISSNTWTRFPSLPYRVDGLKMLMLEISTGKMGMFAFGGYNKNVGATTSDMCVCSNFSRNYNEYLQSYVLSNNSSMGPCWADAICTGISFGSKCDQ
jgi:hypothetical protein